MRVSIVTESFPPDVNGVANSVVRVADHLVARGHLPQVIAPQPPQRGQVMARGESSAAGPTGTATGSGFQMPDHGGHWLPYPVVRVPSLPMPGYNGLRLGLPARLVIAAMRDHGTDVVHLASPFVLGAWGAIVANRLHLPTVAVYQTDVAGFARSYKMWWGEGTAWRWTRSVHARADRTLAPSTSAAADLVAHGVDDVWLWRRGVDAVLFHPDRRDDALRRTLAPGGEVLVGYVGRLAPEKRVDLLDQVAAMPGIRLVVVGDGPAAESLRRALPTAMFVGAKHGVELARYYASLDIFVHTGPLETYCQAVQEAMASGVPVVAPAAGGLLDLVAAGRTGELVPPRDSASIAAVVAELAASPERRRAYGTAARQAVQSRTWTAIGDELIAHYRAVLGERVVTMDHIVTMDHVTDTADVPGGSEVREHRTLPVLSGR